MADANLEMVKEKLFSVKDPSQKMNDAIKIRVEKLREENFRRLKPSMYEGKDEPLSQEDYEKISNLADFISGYIRDVGKEQAILDFQVGLNLLNDYKKDSVLETKIQLKEDADFGEKTFKALFDVLRNYPVEIIKRYIKLGALNNQIWNTKNSKNIDTDSKVVQTANKIAERSI